MCNRPDRRALPLGRRRVMGIYTGTVLRRSQW